MPSETREQQPLALVHERRPNANVQAMFDANIARESELQLFDISSVRKREKADANVR